MSKFRKLVPKTVEQHYEETRTVCDFCGEDIVKDRCINKKVQEGNATEITIDARIGNSWEGGEADCRDGFYMDACEKCFLSIVRPGLEKLGGKWQNYDPGESWNVKSKYSNYYLND